MGFNSAFKGLNNRQRNVLNNI